MKELFGFGLMIVFLGSLSSCDGVKCFWGVSGRKMKELECPGSCIKLRNEMGTVHICSPEKYENGCRKFEGHLVCFCNTYLCNDGEMPSNVPESPLMTYASPESPLVTHASPESPLMTHASPESPLMTHASPESPLMPHAVPEYKLIPLKSNFALQAAFLPNRVLQSAIRPNIVFETSNQIPLLGRLLIDGPRDAGMPNNGHHPEGIADEAFLGSATPRYGLISDRIPNAALRLDSLSKENLLNHLIRSPDFNSGGMLADVLKADEMSSGDPITEGRVMDEVQTEQILPESQTTRGYLNDILKSEKASAYSRILSK